MNKRRIFCLVLLWTCLTVLPCQADKLSLLTEENPPYNFTRDGQPSGLYIDVVHEIQRRIGNKDLVTVMPWARAWRLAQHEANTALFSTTRTPEREPHFQWVGPISTGENALFALGSNKIRIRTLQEAKMASYILVPKDSFLEQILIHLGFTNLMQTQSPEMVLRMLQAGRAPLLFSSESSLNALVLQNNIPANTIRKVYTLAKAQGYIAFSANTPANTVKQWQDTLNQMKQDGSFNAIFHHWLADPIPPGLTPATDVWPNTPYHR